MNRDQITAWAREAGFVIIDTIHEECVERFAALVAAAEKNRLADAIEKMPFGDTASSFAAYVRNFK